MPGLPELELVQMLCDGVDPRTGEMLATPRNLRVDEARIRYLKALQALEKERQPAGAGGTVVSHMGARWSATDDAILKRQWAETPGPTIEALGVAFGRTPGAIAARLVHLELFPDREAVRVASEARAKLASGAPAPAREAPPPLNPLGEQLATVMAALDLQGEPDIRQVQKLLHAPELLEVPTDWARGDGIGADWARLSGIELDAAATGQSLPALRAAVDQLVDALDEKPAVTTTKGAAELAERFRKIAALLHPHRVAELAQREARAMDERVLELPSEVLTPVAATPKPPSPPTRPPASPTPSRDPWVL